MIRGLELSVPPQRSGEERGAGDSVLSPRANDLIIHAYKISLLKNTVQLSKVKDPIGFIQGFMNQAASHLASRNELQGAIQSRRLLQTEGARTRKKWIASSFGGGMKGSIRGITSLLLIRKFQTDWLRLHYWERLRLQSG